MRHIISVSIFVVSGTCNAETELPSVVYTMSTCTMVRKYSPGVDLEVSHETSDR